MSTIIELFNAVLKLAFFGGFILLAFHLMKSKKTNTVKTEILNLQARLSKLRLSLKGKIKKKSHLFRAQLGKFPLVEGDPIDTTLKQLIENPFETSQNFQNYFDQSRAIVNFIRTETKIELDRNVSLENNFMCPDFKTELDIVRIIKEMSLISAKINSRVENYNLTNPNQPLQKVDSLVFESLADVNRIYKDENNDEPAHIDDVKKKAA